MTVAGRLQASARYKPAGARACATALAWCLAALWPSLAWANRPAAAAGAASAVSAVSTVSVARPAGAQGLRPAAAARAPTRPPTSGHPTARATPHPEPPLLPFSTDERAALLQHGPWPPPSARDPGNRLSGQPAAIALGQRLFFDPRLSPDSRQACASCHVPGLGFADGRRRAEGRQTLARHTPSLWNAGQQRWLGWDGAHDSLWSQALQPLLHPQEMASHPAHLRQLLASDPGLGCAVQALAPPTGLGDDDALLTTLAKALGAYVATLTSGRTPFDDFRDALARGDTRAAARYPLPAQRGARLFVGRARCALCHAGPLFSHGEFADIGLPFFSQPGVVDPGRHGGITALLASPHNLLGRHSDAPGGPAAPEATKTRHVQAQHRHFGEFKVPSLRGVADTAPYMHDGQLPDLARVLAHYNAISPDRLHADGEQLLQPLHLGPHDLADLLAFLHTLSPQRPPALTAGPAAAQHTRRAAGPQACPGALARALR